MRRRWIWIIVMAAVGGGAALLFLFPGKIRDAAGLAAEGGEIALREPMRTPRGGPRLLLVALDGVGDEELRRAIRVGHLPTVQRLFGRQIDDDVYEHAYAAPGVLTILPSTTMAGWSSVFTGMPPAHTGVPGNEWYDRDEQRFYAPAPVTTDDHAHALEMFSDGLLGRAIRVPTLFERLDVRAHVSLMPVHRGADLLIVPSIGDIAALFGAMARGLTDDDPVDRDQYATLDAGAIEKVVERMREHGVPDVQVVYFAGIDLYTHFAEPPLPEMHRYLHDVFDPALRRLLDAYEALGLLEETSIVLVADHGHTPVLRDERHALATDRERDPPAVLEQAGHRVRPFELDLEEEQQDYQAVLAYQGAFAFVYLADRSSCQTPGQRCDWQRPARFHEDVMPIVQAFDRATREGAYAPKLQGTIDLIFAREPPAPGQTQQAFRVWDGARLVPIGEYLAAHPRPHLLDLEARLEGLAVGPYGYLAGDVLLMARSGMNRPIFERFYFSELYNSWHGSAEAADSRIPLVVAHARRSGHDLKAQVDAVIGRSPSQLHVTPLVEALMRGR